MDYGLTHVIDYDEIWIRGYCCVEGVRVHPNNFEHQGKTFTSYEVQVAEDDNESSWTTFFSFQNKDVADDFACRLAHFIYDGSAENYIGQEYRQALNNLFEAVKDAHEKDVSSNFAPWNSPEGAALYKASKALCKAYEKLLRAEGVPYDD